MYIVSTVTVINISVTTYLANIAIGVTCSDELIIATTRPGASLSRRCLVALEM